MRSLSLHSEISDPFKRLENYVKVQVGSAGL